ncbi:MAG: DUF4250 domain-containing protein [Lachnospiraceae bacterium]|nr:DUF4250 domain-containing protein [Lachnospiraceae bacterium]
MKIPNDPMMLLSFINTQLRDHYATFDNLCEENDLDSDAIQLKLSSADYYYDTVANQFV